MRNKIFIPIVVVLVAIAAYYFARLSKSPAESPSPSPTSSQEASGIKTFTSNALGISFDYNSKPAGATISVKQEGGKVFVYPTSMAPEAGQFVQVFQKDKNETFEASIKRQILANFPSPQCKIEISRSNIYSQGYIAEISYPAPTDKNQPFFQNMELCNKNYDKTNGIRYFLYDPNHPDKFVYFDIGQYAISSGHGVDGMIPWQDTIKFLD